MFNKTNVKEIDYLDSTNSKGGDILKLKNENNLRNFDLCYSRYDELVDSFIENYRVNNFLKMKEILKETSGFLLDNDPSKYINLDEITNKLISIFNNIKTSENKSEAENICYKEIRRTFHAGSCYSLFFAFNDICEKIERFVINPEFNSIITDKAKFISVEILENGFLKKNDVQPDTLNYLEENDICFTDNNRIFLTAKGVNLARSCKNITHVPSIAIETDCEVEENSLINNNEEMSFEHYLISGNLENEDTFKQIQELII